MIRALRSKHLVHGTSHWLSGWYKKPWNQWASPTLTTVDQMANRIFVLDTPCSSLIKDWVDAWHMEPKLFFPLAIASGKSFLQTRSSEIWWCCLANWFGDWTFDCNVRINPSSGSRIGTGRVMILDAHRPSKTGRNRSVKALKLFCSTYIGRDASNVLCTDWITTRVGVGKS